MSNISLTHEFSPPELKRVNEQLEAILTADEIDDKQLVNLVDERHQIILQHLSALDDDEERQFAQSEYDINQTLNEYIEKIKKLSLDKASKFARGRRVVGKYYK